MAAEAKSIRLSKAAKEFNIGTTTVVEFLAKKGFEIDANPNSKISEEMYQLLQKEFESEKTVKEAASQVGLDYKKESLSIEGTVKPAAKPEQEDQELIIKKSTLEKEEKPKKTSKKKEEQPKEETAAVEKVAKPKKVEEPVVVEEPEIIEEKVVVEEVPVVVEEVVEEEVKEAVKEAVKEVEVEEIVEVVEVEEPTPTVQEEKDDSKGGLKIIDKIDLAALGNTKTRPDKKTKKEKEAEKAKKEAEAKAKKQAEEVAIAAKTVVKESVKEEVVAEAPIVEEEAKKKPEERVPEHYETKHVTISGPKIVGQKIDLEQFNRKPKPVATSKDKDNKGGQKKEKRQRIDSGQKKGVGVDPKKMAPPAGSGHKHDKKGKKAPRVLVEVDEAEIKKQIQETLSRLNPMGKSKTSKHRREKRQQVSQQMQEEQIRMQEGESILKVTEFVTANELATMMNLSVNSIISTCMSIGMPVSINQRLTAEVISVLAEEFGFKVEFVDVEVLEDIQEEEDKPEDMKPRPPIVTVMGHVDHGKTSLLDYVRKTNVIAGEAGGITQHIGAYEVQLESGKKITFLDTPGHEAFTAMRARGAKITDIAIIVIAADDRIMPQTKEAISHAQAASVPIVFAINKIDKPSASPDKIKQELAEMNLLVEEWGGKYQSQDISAKQGLHVEELLEKVLLEAELLDLKANPNKRAKGTVIESSLDKGRGYVAKILVEDGTVNVGDSVIAGHIYGRVKAMYNERNQLVKSVGPATPMLLLGLNGAPQAGDLFNVMPSEKEAKDIATRRQQLQREQGLRTQKHITLDEIGRRIAIGDFKELNIIVKGDVDGSVEALSASLLKLSTPEVQVNVIHQSVGQITESDVLLASASEAIIIGFQVRPSLSARKLAEQEQIDIRLYSIIYNAIEEIKDAIEGMLSPDIEEKIIGNLEVREIFKINKVGTIAGCMVLDGKLARQTKIRIIRDGIVVYTGKLGSLKRFKDDVKEVFAGQDCGLNVENFNDVKVGDIIEGYEETEIKRKL